MQTARWDVPSVLRTAASGRLYVEDTIRCGTRSELESESNPDLFLARDKEENKIAINLRTGMYSIVEREQPPQQPTGRASSRLEYRKHMEAYLCRRGRYNNGHSKVIYDPENTNTVGEEFIRQVFPEYGHAEYVQKVLGYMLTGHTSENVLFVLGDENQLSSGKSTLLRLIDAVMGNYCETCPISNACYLQHVKRCIRSGDHELVINSEYKRLLDDIIHTRNGSFKNTCKFIIVGDSIAFPIEESVQKHIILLSTPVKFERRKSDYFDDVLNKPEVLTGFLNFLVKGSANWYSEGLTVPSSGMLTKSARKM